MFKQKRCAAMHQKIQSVSSSKVCSSKNDVPQSNKKASQFQAVKYVQAKTMRRTAKKASQFQAVKYVQAKTMRRDATKNLDRFKQ